jgi:hypothetical protein
MEFYSADIETLMSGWNTPYFPILLGDASFKSGLLAMAPRA